MVLLVCFTIVQYLIPDYNISFQVYFNEESVFSTVEETSQCLQERRSICMSVCHSDGWSSISVIVWNPMSVQGPRRLYRVGGTKGQVQYITMLNTRLVAQIRQWFADNEGFLWTVVYHVVRWRLYRCFYRIPEIETHERPGDSGDIKPTNENYVVLLRES